MKKQLLILITLCTATIGYSQTFNALDNNNNTLEYNITSANTVEVKDYISGGTDIDIPVTVDNTVSSVTTTYTVTGIRYLAFQNNGLTSVIISNSVITVGTSAFSGNALTSATIGNNVISIGSNVFLNNQLTTITIPNSVTSIGSYAFKDNSLMNLTIGNSVTTIGDFAFSGNQLINITLPNSVTTIGDVAFQANPLTCIISEATTPPTINSTNSGLDTFSFAQRSNIDLTIPSGTASAYATAQWTGFNSVAEGLTGTFVVDHITYQINATPNNEVTVTGYNTAGGTVVNIPATVTSGCTDFSVTSVGLQAFMSKGLTSVTISDNVISIADAAFATNPIAALTLGLSLETIGTQAFDYNNQLTSVIFPASLTYIGNYAFNNSPLTSVTCTSITPPGLSTYPVFLDRSTTHLHIPGGAAVMGAYVTDAGALWTGFNPVTQDVLGVSDFELNSDINVITTIDAIKVMHSNSIRLKNYAIYSITGAKVITGKERNIDTSFLLDGIYILKLDFDKGRTVNKKIIIK